MGISNSVYTVTEYGAFTKGVAAEGYTPLPEKTFEALENFVLSARAESGTEAIELLSLTARRGLGKIITAKNYVGVIVLPGGAVIEILPKIAGALSEEEARRVFLNMLRALREAPFRDFEIARLETGRLNLFEIFIRFFLDDVTVLTRQGFAAAYTPLEENAGAIRGKLMIPQNITHNIAHKERFFVRTEEFHIDRPENRLIKSALRLLQEMSRDGQSRRTAARLLSCFEGVSFSANYDADFARCAPDRRLRRYERILAWCRIVLKGRGYTPFHGNEEALALLFPMEKVFESFVAEKIRQRLAGTGITLRVQDARHSLISAPARLFPLRPDLVLIHQGQVAVLDTKWKLLSDARNYGISQADMYQMYAYGKKYGASRVFLLYPRPGAFAPESLQFDSGDGVLVHVSFVDLKAPEESLKKILSEAGCLSPSLPL